MYTPPVIPIIPDGHNQVWSRIAFTLTLAIGVIALLGYIENRKNNRIQQQLIELQLKKIQKELGDIEQAEKK